MPKYNNYYTGKTVNSTTIKTYEITKIVRALWLAERNVCMRVRKHGCDVRCFAFRALIITQARIWKRFSDQNLTSLLYLPFLRWLKIFTNELCQLFSLKLKNPYFGKHLLAKQELITRERFRVQDFATGKNFCFNQCHNKEFCVFSQESYFIKVIENFFPVFT